MKKLALVFGMTLAMSAGAIACEDHAEMTGDAAGSLASNEIENDKNIDAIESSASGAILIEEPEFTPEMIREIEAGESEASN